MIDEELLQTLAVFESPGTPIRPLPEVISRARVLRHRRRTAGIAGTSLVVGVAVLVAGLTLAGSSPKSTVRPAVPAVTSCNPEVVHHLTPKDIPDVLYLAPKSLTGPFTQRLNAMKVHSECPTASQSAVWYATTNGAITRNLEVDGPHAPGYGQGGNLPELTNPIKYSVDILGSAGTLYYSVADGQGKLSWTTPDGLRWAAQARGLTCDQTLAAVRDVVINHGRIDRDRIPAGLTRAAPLLGGPPPTGNTEEFDAPYRNWGLGTISLGSVPYAGKFGAHTVDINGQDGWLVSETKTFFLSWPLPNGVLAYIIGTIPQQKALTIARAVTKVSPDDPRLASSNHRKVNP